MRSYPLVAAAIVLLACKRKLSCLTSSLKTPFSVSRSVFLVRAARSCTSASPSLRLSTPLGDPPEDACSRTSCVANMSRSSVTFLRFCKWFRRREDISSRRVAISSRSLLISGDSSLLASSVGFGSSETTEMGGGVGSGARERRVRRAACAALILSRSLKSALGAISVGSEEPVCRLDGITSAIWKKLRRIANRWFNKLFWNCGLLTEGGSDTTNNTACTYIGPEDGYGASTTIVLRVL
ncbi:unnamed protein product [Chondrus crispus]|uniref:Secreted protein n=1 Tax=Chondrus crispus TaxID=2769 RepID=R7QMH8_CHOCR|nr:unnamed protein product [Chondrus crispus]CDF39304.1 unnamed protein product [Chondrus crispus]|eukprot:XP_005719215.1 unnamed protein product [Chondrus crispus]